MSERKIKVNHSTSTAHRLLYYDGACNNVHGHNMEWDVKITVEMDEVGEDNMAIDFKKVSSLLDETDHAIILNEEDPLVEHADILGSVITVSGDPTVEYMTEWMAEKFLELEEVVSVTVSCAETDKYDIEYSA